MRKSEPSGDRPACGGRGALPMPAAAYVRTMTESGEPTAWKTPCVTMEISLGAPPPELDAQGYFSAAQAAGAAWSQAALDGSTDAPT